MKRGMRSVIATALVLGLAGISFNLQGCKHRATPLEACQNVCECYAAAAGNEGTSGCGASTVAMKECADDVEAQRELAEKDDCTAEFDAYINCVADYDGTCESLPNICDEENKTYNECSSNSSG